MVSSNEAGFNLRERMPLPQDLARWGSDRIRRHSYLRWMTEAGEQHDQSKDTRGQPDLPSSRSGYREERDGLLGKPPP
jgi:hypothetical protein